jgi:predicted HTH transcriptional regulator
VLGVEERDGAASVVGVGNAPTQLQTLHNMLRDPQKISYPLCGPADVSVESVGDKQVLVLRVPAAPRQARPVYVNGNPYTGTYVRRHAGDYRCTKPEVDRMMREASDAPADGVLLRHYGWEDVDLETLGRYRRRYQTSHPDSPWNAYDDRRFLEAIGGFRRDTGAGSEGLTVAGLLLVGTEAAIRRWRTRHLIDYRMGPEHEADTRWDDRVVWEGNLLSAFEVISPRLVDGLRVPFRLEGPVRTDQSPVHVAVREALVNLLVHTDYAETQALLIKRSPEGFYFRNPGNSRVPQNELLTGDRSDPRNPDLLRMFRLIGLAEEAGSGMPKIVASWRALGYQPPEIEAGTERYEFEIWLRHAHLLSDDDRDWLRSLGNTWTEAEQVALIYARDEGEIDNWRLRTLTGQHPADITRVLGSLRSRGLLQMMGTGRGSRYQLGPEARPTDTRTPGISGQKASSLGGSLGGSLGDNVTDSTLDDDGVLRQIAAPARSQRRLDADVRDSIVVALCARRPLTLQQIAQLLDRDLTYVREVVRGLVEQHRLAYRYPDRLRHPNQRYIATPAPSISRTP